MAKLACKGGKPVTNSLTGNKQISRRSDLERKYLTNDISFSVDFDFVNLAHKIIETFRAKLRDSAHGERVTFVVEVRSSQLKAFTRKLVDATNGQVEFH